MNRTIWIAGFCLVIICCLLATKMVLAAVSPADLDNETTSTVIVTSVPGVDTLSDTDRSFGTPIDVRETTALPLVSRSVLAEARGASAARRVRAAHKKQVLRPLKRHVEPVKTVAVPCRELDPIARFLASSKIGPGCQA
ncbi:MAG: hypothetical protein E6813_05510 [Bradyrhizobium sp.]|uniref:hypothetical protein n=1 Tax=Bradyrhizobium sp. TaxID=376 RepID=UPI0029051342|nr:hypothetical protein [Bradyrhizobium sp.]MDU1802892.1 hypothetical protein [Bradyrhizobium sp.]